MNAILRGIRFELLKWMIKPGNVTIIAASDFRVPPRKHNYQIHGYRVEVGDWVQNIVILPIDDDKKLGPNAISTVRSMLTVMGFKVSPIMLAYAFNKGDCPACTEYTAMERA